MSSSKSYVCGIFGFPISHSASPVMHHAAFQALKLDGSYTAFEISPKNIKKAVEAIRLLNLTGMNVTIPFKEKVLPWLDELSPEARLMGAVNTIHNVKGRLMGFNTDARGFQMALEEDWGNSLKGKNLCLIGAGGAARAVAVQSGLIGVKKLMIVNRNQTRLKKLITHLNKNFPHLEIVGLGENDKNIQKEIQLADCVVNATSLGMKAQDPLPMPISWILKKTYVYDLIYRPFQTRFVKEALRQGCRASGGLKMLLYQGALSFEIWTGRKAPVKIMEAALKKELRVRG